jgi:DNA-binding response OmpR family regulator
MDETPAFQAPGQEVPIILIVDDEAAIAETLSDFIQELGYISQVAYNGQQALALAQKQWPTLVITDLMMPVLDGAHLIAALRAEASQRELVAPPIILLTAVGSRVVNGARAEVVLAKPFDFDHLEQIIHRLLASSSGKR